MMADFELNFENRLWKYFSGCLIFTGLIVFVSIVFVMRDNYASETDLDCSLCRAPTFSNNSLCFLTLLFAFFWFCLGWRYAAWQKGNRVEPSNDSQNVLIPAEKQQYLDTIDQLHRRLREVTWAAIEQHERQIIPPAQVQHGVPAVPMQPANHHSAFGHQFLYQKQHQFV